MRKSFFETPYSALEPILFMHVPKSSGISMTQAAMNALLPRATFQGLDRSIFGLFQHFGTLDPDLRKMICFDFKSIPPDADFVAGHFSYSTLSQVRPTGQLITVLREPISRILSHWLYWRAQSDESLVAWGDWADFVRCARRPLEDFLTHEDLGCQIDNLTVRMLLWPHPRIPSRGFINADDDANLIIEASERLERFTFVDAIETPDFPGNLGRWLGKPVKYGWHNETPAIAAEFTSSLYRELTSRTLELLESHSRLDRQLWERVIAYRAPALNPERLQRRVLMRNVARYAALLCPFPTDNG
jgi:hypothetical protein